jgi:hypothetical protein
VGVGADSRRAVQVSHAAKVTFTHYTAEERKVGAILPNQHGQVHPLSEFISVPTLR